MNDADWTQGGESGQAHHEMAERAYNAYREAHTRTYQAENKHGVNSSQATQARHAEAKALQAALDAGYEFGGLGPSGQGKGGRDRRSSRGRNGGNGGGLPGPKSPPVDQ